MKTKKTFYGLIDMNATLYNILYTVLCVCFLAWILFCFLITTFLFVKKGYVNTSIDVCYYFSWAMTFLIGEKLLNKKNYA